MDIFTPISAIRQSISGSLLLFFWSVHGVNAQVDDYDPATLTGSVFAAGQKITDPALADEGEGDRTLFVMELKVKKGWENNFIFIHIWGGEGNAVYPGAADPAMGMAPGELELAAAQYSRTFFEFLTLTIGKINPGAYFDSNAFANDSYTQFLAYGFSNNSTILFPGHKIGYLLEAAGGEAVTFQFGVFEDRDAEVPSELKEKFIIGELGLHYSIVDSPGNFRLIGWNSGVLEQAGAAISFDQALGEYLAVFTRFGANSNAEDNAIASAFSVGTRINVADLFHIGLAYEVQVPGDTELFDSQGWFETYVGWTLDDGVTFGIDLQAVDAPEFDITQDGPLVLSFRVYAPL